MKQLLTAILLFLSIHINAQQMVSVIDAETREPVVHAAFIQNGDTITFTSSVGIAVLPKIKGNIQLYCKNYKSIDLNADSIPAVIHMKCLVQRLDELVVIGDSTKIKKGKKFDLPDNILLEYELKDAYKNSGKLATTSLYKFLGYEPKSVRKKKKLKKLLESYSEEESKEKKK